MAEGGSFQRRLTLQEILNERGGVMAGRSVSCDSRVTARPHLREVRRKKGGSSRWTAVEML